MIANIRKTDGKTAGSRAPAEKITIALHHGLL
jgi:hypothetical protein